jgi:heme/copper-type cytochrome/quinol oxidase subunit 2
LQIESGGAIGRENEDGNNDSVVIVASFVTSILIVALIATAVVFMALYFKKNRRYNNEKNRGTIELENMTQLTNIIIKRKIGAG